jgi:hypothetical protein
MMESRSTPPRSSAVIRHMSNGSASCRDIESFDFEDIGGIGDLPNPYESSVSHIHFGGGGSPLMDAIRTVVRRDS